LGSTPASLRVVLLDLTHRAIYPGADGVELGQGQQIIEARLGAEIEDAFGVIGSGFIDPAASTGRFA